jgi:hypothetical protein
VIFGRKKQQATPSEPEDIDDELDDAEADEDVDDLDDEGDEDDAETTGESPDDDEDVYDDDHEDAQDEWVAYDESQDWREEGPFDISEVDLEGDDVTRLDLGSLIVTPEEGMQLQIIADSESGNGLALVLGLNGSAMQIEVKAAPNSGGFAADIRSDIMDETRAAGGRTELAKGPYGTELRRVVQVEGADGEDAFAPMRDWLVEGPRWLLVARLMGEAAIDVEGDGASEIFDEAFRNLIVRRGDEPMAPGQTVPIRVPEG